MANQQGQAFEDLRNTINECTRIVRYRWRLALVGLASIGSIAFWYSQYLPREYSATTLFERRDDVVLQNLIRGSSPYSFAHLKTTMKMDMTDTRALGMAMVRCGLLPPETFASTEALTDAERGAVNRVRSEYQLLPSLRMLHSTANLDTIELRCRANDPEIAQQIVVALRDNYIEKTRDRISEILNGTEEFFESEVQRLEHEARQAEQELAQGFEAFPGLDPTDVVGAGNRLEMLRAQRDALYQRKAELEAELSAREAFLRETPSPDPFRPASPPAPESAAAAKPAPVANPVATLDMNIKTVQQEIVDLMTMRGMTAEHPEVKRRYARLDALQDLRVSLLDSQTSAPVVAEADTPELVTIPTPEVSETYLQWQAQRMRVELEMEALRRQTAIASTQLNEADDRLHEFESLYNRLVEKEGDVERLLAHQSDANREANVWRGHLTSLQRILKAETGKRGTQFTLLEEPQDVTRPTKPRVASVFVVCSALGIAAAALLVALSELFDRSFRSVGQVTRVLGIPVLECVATVPTPREKRRIAIRRMFWVPTILVLVAALSASASLAYASLQMPRVHERAMQRVNSILGNVGIASVSNAEGATPVTRSTPDAQ